MLGKTCIIYSIVVYLLGYFNNLLGLMCACLTYSARKARLLGGSGGMRQSQY